MQRALWRLGRGVSAWQRTAARLQRATLGSEGDARDVALQTLHRIAQRLPASGYSAAEMHTLIEDSYALFTPTALGALTLREALQLHPQWFVVEEHAHGGWSVKPTAAAAAAAAAVPAPPSASDRRGSDAASAHVTAATTSAAATTMTMSTTLPPHIAAAYRAVVQTCEADARAARAAASDVATAAAVQTSAARAASTSAPPYVALEDVLRRAGVGGDDVDVVDAIVHAAQQPSSPLDVRVRLYVRPRRPPRGAVVFVDADALDDATVRQLCQQLNVLPAQSQMYTVRRPGEAPRNHHSSNNSNSSSMSGEYASSHDVVAPWVVPLHMVVEREARLLQLRTPALLCDVVYLCGDASYELYCSRVAPRVPFCDADVYVCSPQRAALVQAKQVVPYVEDDGDAHESAATAAMTATASPSS